MTVMRNSNRQACIQNHDGGGGDNNACYQSHNRDGGEDDNDKK